MERYQVILAYDGSQYRGFQRQANAHTVQGVVESTLRKLGWQGNSVLAAGRTDTGVHATGQVIAFDLDWSHTPQDLQQALNAALPLDLAALSVRQVRADFHPRYDAAWRRYRYQLTCQPVRQPLLERYAWRVWPAVDLTLLSQTAQFLPGKHEFSAFGTPAHFGGSTVRTILEADWKEEATLFIFEIAAHAFLYHMVRRLVYMQVMVGQGKLEPEVVRQSLASGVCGTMPAEALVHGLAPAQGLILTEVHYPREALASEDNREEIK